MQTSSLLLLQVYTSELLVSRISLEKVASLKVKQNIKEYTRKS